MHRVNRSAVILKPKVPFIKWANWAYKISGDDREYSPVYFTKDCTVLLIPKCFSEKEVRVYIATIWKSALEAELQRWLIPEPLWPKDRTKELFRQWFGIEFHSTVFDSE